MAMPEFHLPDQSPDESNPYGSMRVPNRLSEFSESPAVSKLCDIIAKYSSSDLLHELQLAKAQGILTADCFTQIIRGSSDHRSLSIVAGSLLEMLNQGVNKHFADCMSAVAHVSYVLLTDKRTINDERRQVAHELLEAVVALMGSNADAHAAMAKGLDRDDFAILLRTINDGDQFDMGYWSCLELQTLCAPTITNLQRMFDAHELIRDTIKEREHPSQALARSVLSLAQRDFRGVFDLVVREAARCAAKEVKQSYDFEMIDYAVAGLAMACPEQLDEFLPRLFSTDRDEFEIAAKVVVFLGRQINPKPSDEICERIRLVVFDVLDGHPWQDRSERLKHQVLALRALAAVADPDKDLPLIQGCANKLLNQQGPTPELIPLFDELVDTYVDGLKVSPLGPPPPVPPRPDQADMDGCSGRCAEAWHPLSLEGDDINAQMAEAAIVLAGIKRRSEAAVLGAQIERLVLSEKLQPRHSSEGSVFVKLSDARAFVKRFELLIVSGYCLSAAALLPEALSILKCTEETDIRETKKIEDTYQHLSACLVKLALALGRDERAMGIGAARLSQSDWSLLRQLHKSDEFDHGRAAPFVTVAALSLRAAIENDESWHQDFLEAASQAELDASYFMTPCFLGEQLQRGSSWALLEKLNFRRHTEALTWSIAAGIRLTLPEGFDKIFEYINSKKAEDIAKGLLLAQALRHEFTEEQCGELEHLARLYLDEPGELGLDALATYSCFASEKDSANEILSFRPPVGIDVNRFRATQDLAIARSLKNYQLGAAVMRELEFADW